MDEEINEYYNCEKIEKVYTNMDDFGNLNVCDICGKVVADAYGYFDACSDMNE